MKFYRRAESDNEQRYVQCEGLRVWHVCSAFKYKKVNNTEVNRNLASNIVAVCFTFLKY